MLRLSFVGRLYALFRRTFGGSLSSAETVTRPHHRAIDLDFLLDTSSVKDKDRTRSRAAGTQ